MTDAIKEAVAEVERRRAIYDADPNRGTLSALVDAKTVLYQLRMAPTPRRERTTYAVDCWEDDDSEG